MVSTVAYCKPHAVYMSNETRKQEGSSNAKPTFTDPPPSKLLRVCCRLTNSYGTFPGKFSLGHEDQLPTTMHPQQKIGKTDSAWENDMFCSLYTPPTNLSIVKTGGQGGVGINTPNLTGPHLGVRSFYNGHVTRAAKILT